MDNAKILDRVKKLMALAGSPNEHEAQTAAAMAARLMLDHKIEQSMLETADDTDQPLQTTEEVIDASKAHAKWKSWLAGALCSANSCHAMICGGGLTVFGTHNDVATTRYMFAYLTRVINRLANAHSGGRSGANAFRLGAVSAISERLRADRAQHEAAIKQASAASATALVRVQSDALRVKSAFEARTKGFRAGRARKSRVDASSYNAGRSAGQSINLSSGRGALGAPRTQIRA
jgi:hypothetical protein